jgi:hypothetical protein
MRDRILVVAAFIALLATLAPAHATPTATLFASYSFTAGLEGWTASEGGSLASGPSGLPGADDDVLEAFATDPGFLAHSPTVPADTKNVVWHFRLAGGGTPTGVVAGARGPGDEEVFSVATAGNLLYVHDAGGYQQFETGMGSSWHRLDFEAVGGVWRITFDESEVIDATPASGAALSSFVVAPDMGSRIEADGVRFLSAGTVVDNAYIPDSTYFTHVGEGPLLGFSQIGGGMGFRERGYLKIIGSNAPGERQFVTWTATGLGNTFAAEVAFKHASALYTPDHVALLAGLGGGLAPRWAITIAPVPGDPANIEYWFVDGAGNATELGAPFPTVSWRQIRVIADRTAGTLDVSTSHGHLATLTADLASTGNLAVGDVYKGVGTPALPGVPFTGPSGNNEVWFDDLMAAPLA